MLGAPSSHFRHVPKTGKGLSPDEYDRLMGVGSVESTSEEDRNGDGELTDSEAPTPQEPQSHSGVDSRPGRLWKARGGVVMRV